MKYLLDTNIISNLVIEPQGRAAQKLEAVGEGNVFTSVIAHAELMFGVRKRGSSELARKVGNVVYRLYVDPFAPPADSHYAEIRLELERRGEIIGPNDLLIAAHALAVDATLVTDNVKEFSRVPGLRVENWLRA
ncbi:type II toxin-antitoxin system VapC family toxin [Chelativorans sp.]|uniref:type II toxin-antitoxin system VapC family toxin n=1 Tax=Chelativorans sp. TaxID=2203393 RepID=UPI002810A668|nr:type II toxin-antitoxin system VapC family toxin [Chelativorans sp.]